MSMSLIYFFKNPYPRLISIVHLQVFTWHLVIHYQIVLAYDLGNKNSFQKTLYTTQRS